jgi:hyperosmotically inducible periplasmic protein
MRKIQSVLAPALFAGLLVACASTPTAQSTGAYIDDTTITVKVKAAFVEDKQVKASDIAVNTYNGTVQLSGFADSQGEIDRAVQLASAVRGVKEVHNDVRVKPLGNDRNARQ